MEMNVEMLDYLSKNREELDAETAARLRERDLLRLQKMTAYCRWKTCLRQYVLQYFGEQAAHDCGNCCNCLRNFEEIEISREARVILRCVTELGEAFGMGVVTETLCGADTERVRKFHMDRESTFGYLQEMTQTEVRSRIRFLVEEGILALSTGPYPVLQLGPNAESVLHGEELYMRAPRAQEKSVRAAAGELDVRQSELLSRLKALRAGIARRQGVPAYVVFSDKTLRELARIRPRTQEEFLAVNGVGEAKAARYGRAFLAEMEAFDAYMV